MSARGMILLERDTLEELRDAVRENVDRAVALLYLARDDRAQVTAILRHIAQTIQTDVTRIIVSARMTSAKLAYSTVVIEARLNEQIDEPEDNQDDEARAMAVGFSYASAWLMAALAALLLKHNDIRRTTKTVDYKLETIAITEVAQAYGQATIATYDVLPASYEFLKRWDAELDLKVCKTCASHDGEEVPLNQDFRDGHVPGDIHPRCRCRPTLVRVSAKQAA